MNRIFLLLSLLITCSLQIMGQTDFYYYNGNKIPLTFNEKKVCINIPKDRTDIIERLQENVQTLCMIKDETFDIHVLLSSEYDRLASQDFWSADAKAVILTDSYLNMRGEEVYATPYLHVRLKKAEDIDLLKSYAGRYGLRIVKNNAFMPLWYILSVTLDSNRNSVECANLLYESGCFAATAPDLVSADYQYDTTTIHDTPAQQIVNGKSLNSKCYDLSGRRINNGPLPRGVYIKDGRKMVVK